MRWRVVVLCFAVATLATVIAYFLLDPPCTGPVCGTLAIERELLSRAKQGDGEAAYELAGAYSFVDPDNKRAISVLRQTAGKGNVRVDALLGQFLVNEFEDRLRRADPPDLEEEAELVRLLEPAAAAGYKSADFYLRLYRRLKENPRIVTDRPE